MALKPVKVSQLNGYIKRILQTDPILGNVSVIGEISNLKYHNSGHVYFTLKDETSKINCFLGASYAESLHYELSDGMEVTASGYISVYERGGSYSLAIRDIAVAGVGNLSIAFEKLKQKLEKEGLFDPDLKKELPFFPKKIAVLTSPTGAAVRDIIKIITGRNSHVDILVYPCLVQGPDAAADISAAIDAVNQLFPETDVMIVGRGGGSMEELWPFNEEIVAKSIFHSVIPVISAVGHETDFTIADFAADRRAETPTAAAQMAVPDIRELKLYCRDLLDSMRTGLHRRAEYLHSRIEQNRKSDLLRNLKQRIELEELRVLREKEKLDALNPAAVLKRGYSILTSLDGKLLTRTEDVRIGEAVTVAVSDGFLECDIVGIRTDNVSGSLAEKE